MEDMTAKELKEQWTVALRSGDFSQTMHTLHDDKGFCCLGVAAKVFGIASEEEMYVEEYDPEKEGCEGPIEIYRKLRGSIPNDVVDTGIEMNDNGHSFNAIAGMIEEKWKV